MLHGNTSDGETGTFPGTWREQLEGATLLRAAEEIAPRASVKGSLFQKLLKPEPQPSGTAVSVLPLWERCRAFQRHSRSGGKFKPG